MSCTTPLIIRPTSAFPSIYVELVRITELRMKMSHLYSIPVANKVHIYMNILCMISSVLHWMDDILPLYLPSLFPSITCMRVRDNHHHIFFSVSHLRQKSRISVEKNLDFERKKKSRLWEKKKRKKISTLRRKKKSNLRRKNRKKFRLWEENKEKNSTLRKKNSSS